MGHRSHLLMEDLQSSRQAHRMGNSVAAIFGKYNLPGLLSGHQNSHPSHMQNTPPKTSPKLHRITESGSVSKPRILLSKSGPCTDKASQIQCLGYSNLTIFLLDLKTCELKYELPLTPDVRWGDRNRMIDRDPPHSRREERGGRQQSLVHSHSDSS